MILIFSLDGHFGIDCVARFVLVSDPTFLEEINKHKFWQIALIKVELISPYIVFENDVGNI